MMQMQGLRTVLLAVTLIVGLAACAVPAAPASEVQAAQPAQAAAGGGPLLASGQVSTSAAQQGVLVTGSGTVTAKPDMAQVSVGVVAQESTAADAMAKNNAQMNEVVEAIKALGIEAKDIQTTGINLYPVYEEQRVPTKTTPPEIVGYRANNNVTVRIRQLDQVGAVLDAAVRAGANSVGGVNFGLQDPKALHNQALEAALQDARAKAELIALTLQLTLGPVTAVSEEQVGIYPQPIAAMALEGRGGGGAPPVEGGELAVTAYVRVVFAIQ